MAAFLLLLLAATAQAAQLPHLVFNLIDDWGACSSLQALALRFMNWVISLFDLWDGDAHALLLFFFDPTAANVMDICSHHTP